MTTPASAPIPTKPRTQITASLEHQPSQSRNITKIIIPIVFIFILLLAGSFGWFYFYGPCGTQPVKDSFTILEQTLTKFDDANTLAASTARIGLSGPISNLQSIRRETDAIKVPACMSKAKNLLVKGMQTDIDAFLAFSSQESDTKVSSLLSSSKLQLSLALDEMKSIQSCSPFCQQDAYDAAP